MLREVTLPISTKSKNHKFLCLEVKNDAERLLEPADTPDPDPDKRQKMHFILKLK